MNERMSKLFQKIPEVYKANRSAIHWGLAGLTAASVAHDIGRQGGIRGYANAVKGRAAKISKVLGYVRKGLGVVGLAGAAGVAAGALMKYLRKNKGAAQRVLRRGKLVRTR